MPGFGTSADLSLKRLAARNDSDDGMTVYDTTFYKGCKYTPRFPQPLFSRAY